MSYDGGGVGAGSRTWTHPAWSAFPRVWIDGERLALCRRMARAAEIGGRSELREGAARQATLAEDNLVGMVGALAGHLHLFGEDSRWRLSRWQANRDPTRGDGGYDVPGCRLDFKSTRLRREGALPGAYHLLVRPRERHPGWVYVQVLVEATPNWCAAYLVGWAHERDLPDQVRAEGVLRGAYALPVTRLRPLMPMPWEIGIETQISGTGEIRLQAD